MSTATRAKRKDSGSWAIAGNTCAVVTASSGPAPVRRSAASSCSSVPTTRGAARGRPPAGHKGVAQRLPQIRKLILTAQKPRPRENPDHRLLDQILRALPRATQRPRSPKRATKMHAQDLRIEPFHAGPKWRPLLCVDPSTTCTVIHAFGDSRHEVPAC
jgi:hypothetical protein